MSIQRLFSLYHKLQCVLLGFQVTNPHKLERNCDVNFNWDWYLNVFVDYLCALCSIMFSIKRLRSFHTSWIYAVIKWHRQTPIYFRCFFWRQFLVLSFIWLKTNNFYTTIMLCFVLLSKIKCIEGGRYLALYESWNAFSKPCLSVFLKFCL